MKYFLDHKEVDIKTLEKVYDNLKPYGECYENLVVTSITVDEIHFTTVKEYF